MVIATFKPHSPAIVPNPQNVLQGVVSSKSTFVFVVPTFIEVSRYSSEMAKAILNNAYFQNWSQSQEASEILTKLKGRVSYLKGQSKVTVLTFNL